MSDLPFKAEYAKSGRAGCRGCKTTIAQGSLRLAVMVQSAYYDGKQPNWYHDECFFKKQRPKEIGEFGNVSVLRLEDQEKIKTQIESCKNSAVLPSAGKGKGKKRANNSASNGSLKDFTVEYAASSRATCKNCDIKITKGEVRIAKKVFDTEIGQKFGGQNLWHHVKCFAEERSKLEFFASGEVLPGFNSLTKEDKIMIKDKLPPLKEDEIPIKKFKEEPKTKEEKKEIDKDEKVYQDQNKMFHNYRSKAQANLSKNEHKELLEYNKQEIPKGPDRILDLLADIMVFGPLLPCDVCKNGQLKLDTHGYICKGNLTEWTKCTVITQEPKRGKFRIPSSLKDNEAFKSYKFKAQVRKFKTLPVPSTSSNNIKTEEKPNVKAPPLKGLKFFSIGLRSSVKEAIKIKILKMGGLFPSSISADIVAVVSTPDSVENMSGKMDEIKNHDIQVIETSFFDEIKSDGTVAQTVSLIDEKNIAPWGTSAASRLSQDVLDGKSASKPKSLYSSSSSKMQKLKLKDGTAVDPDSGLADKAHVYSNAEGVKYTIVLGLTDLTLQKNSFYKLQVLKSDKRDKYWLFRSWGRIGTTIGGNKTESHENIHSAREQFEALFEEKTGYSWDEQIHGIAPKVPGKLYPIDIDFGEVADTVTVDDGKSTLPAPTQVLIKMIFDVNSMKKVLLEFELDTEKMPLGKLSKKQLKAGYSVLTELQKVLSESTSDDKKSAMLILDATNRFYTLIPHNFGAANPPLLNTDDQIKVKREMLDNLLELEIAYTLLQTKLSSDVASPLDSHYLKLKCEIEPIVHDGSEWEMLKKYVTNTHAKTHSNYKLDIVQVFKVNREGEEKRFKPFKKLDNRQLLWHGSRTTNFAGILSQGLRIAPPEAPVTGYMFGKGIYFADMVSKSANYCCTSPGNDIGVMLLCEVALGNIHELTDAKNVVKPPSGFNSVKGVGKTGPDPQENHVMEDGLIVPLGKALSSKIKTSLLYNEFIVYDVAQVRVKYLLQMKFIYK